MELNTTITTPWRIESTIGAYGECSLRIEYRWNDEGSFEIQNCRLHGIKFELESLSLATRNQITDWMLINARSDEYEYFDPLYHPWR